MAINIVAIYLHYICCNSYHFSAPEYNVFIWFWTSGIEMAFTINYNKILIYGYQFDVNHMYKSIVLLLYR